MISSLWLSRLTIWCATVSVPVDQYHSALNRPRNASTHRSPCKSPQLASPPRKEVGVSGRTCATTVEMRIIIMLPVHIKPRNHPGNLHSVSTIEISIPSRCSFLQSCELGFDTAVQCVSTLVDSGSAVKVINQDLTNKFKIPTLPCVPAINITAIDNSPIGSGITATTQPVTLQIGRFHKETIPFYVVPSCKYEVILGHPWLAIHCYFLEPGQTHPMVGILS